MWSICVGLGYFVWSILSMILGLVGGLIFGIFMTLLVFLITLIRTPMHIGKTFYVTATTTECFQPCQNLDPFLRVVVFVLVPIPHLLWLSGVTTFCLTCGTIYYIGKITKMLYLHDYQKNLKKVQSNVKLEKDSHLGNYLKKCRDFMNKDEGSLGIIHFLKGICALIPGIPLGALPFVPFSVVILLITLYRHPINVYKTMKIALFTVVLKWDLRILALIMLPFVHAIFPLVVFVTCIAGSFVFFLSITTESIYSGKSPFDQWGEFQLAVQRYYKAHETFVGERCDVYDHPTGIPTGWRGESYGIPIQRILKWQWDFVVCCALVLFLGFPICLVGSTVICSIKLVPGIFSWWTNVCQHAVEERTTAEILGLWALYLVAMALVPVGAVLVTVICIVVGTFQCLGIPSVYLKHGFAAGAYAAFSFVGEVDKWDVFDLEEFRVLPCFSQKNPYIAEELSNHSAARQDQDAVTKASELYWDRFVSQCIETTSQLLTKRWMTLEDIKCAEPSVIQAIPAVAALTILHDTLKDSSLAPEDIQWNIDGTTCRKKDRPALDNIGRVLWPKVMDAKRLLLSQKKLTDKSNVEVVTAMLCSNTDEIPSHLKEFMMRHKVDDATQTTFAVNKRLQTAIVALALSILQVKPFQDRMPSILNHDYSLMEDDVESGCLRAGDNN